MIWLDLHHDFLHWVFHALRSLPNPCSVYLLSTTTTDILAVQIAVTTCVVPPTTMFVTAQLPEYLSLSRSLVLNFIPRWYDSESPLITKHVNKGSFRKRQNCHIIFTARQHSFICRALYYYYYRAMHYSAKRGIAIACCRSVCLSVCLSVWDFGGPWPHRLENLETNYMGN